MGAPAESASVRTAITVSPAPLTSKTVRATDGIVKRSPNVTAIEPFAIAAVELEKEKMIVLGQVVSGVGTEKLKAGIQMELKLEPLVDGKLTWKWAPVS